MLHAASIPRGDVHIVKVLQLHVILTRTGCLFTRLDRNCLNRISLYPQIRSTPKDFNNATLLNVEYFIDLFFKNSLNPLILFLHIKLTIYMLKKSKFFNRDNNWQSKV